MRAQGIFLNYIEEWARLLFLLQILGFSLSLIFYKNSTVYVLLQIQVRSDSF